MNIARRPLAAAFLTLACTPLFAQSIRDGLSNTLVVSEKLAVPAPKLNADPGNPEAPPASGVTNLSTRGSLTGNVTQTLRGENAAEQSVSVAGVEGKTRANSAELNGGIGANVTQTNNNASSITQRVGAGSLVDSTVSSARTNGEITGPGITQTNNGASSGAGANVQSVEVGSINSTQARSVNARGSLSGEVIQFRGTPGAGTQSLNVGAVTNVEGGGSVSANGTVSSSVSQIANRQVEQRIDVGSVNGGSPAEARTNGAVLGSVSQRADGGGGASVQTVSVGSANNSSGNIQTDATTAGTISQLQGAGTNIEQRIKVGSVDGSRTQAITEVANSGDIIQTTNGASNAVQDVSIGSAENTGAVVTTRAEVTGAIGQFAGNSSNTRQSINLGSVRNADGGTANTNVTVTGNVLQNAINANGGDQRVLVGGVEGKR
ncbi:hypothetical protein [Nitrogeniibacter aestuarii]|uniref:hypothetical protein n=1 Tax=Nitrogeniibacter aestuarii TaxID=2815343 RepID=UPI001D103216|nr:hypothetical protein [Nitrogeniibacter aestuarii]